MKNKTKKIETLRKKYVKVNLKNKQGWLFPIEWMIGEQINSTKMICLISNVYLIDNKIYTFRAGDVIKTVSPNFVAEIMKNFKDNEAKKDNEKKRWENLVFISPLIAIGIGYWVFGNKSIPTTKVTLFGSMAFFSLFIYIWFKRKNQKISDNQLYEKNYFGVFEQIK